MMQLKNLLNRLRHIDKYTLTMCGWAAIAVFSVIIIIVRYVRGEAFDLNTIVSAYLAGQSVGGIFATHLLKLLRERLVIMTNMQGTMDMQQQIMHEQNLVLLRQATALATAPEEGKLN